MDSGGHTAIRPPETPMFRRKPRSYSQMASDIVYPRGGWWRAIKYRVHRLRRLPDPPRG